MTDPASRGNFGRHRKIAPFEPGATPDIEALRKQSREKAASLNQHVLGYGETAEREWAAAGIAAPDLPAIRRYRLERIAGLLVSELDHATLADAIGEEVRVELDLEAVDMRQQLFGREVDVVHYRPRMNPALKTVIDREAVFVGQARG